MEDVILANPDQVLVVFAIVEPDPHLRMLDRFLVIAEANELPAIICVTSWTCRAWKMPRRFLGYKDGAIGAIQ